MSHKPSGNLGDKVVAALRGLADALDGAIPEALAVLRELGASDDAAIRDKALAVIRAEAARAGSGRTDRARELEGELRRLMTELGAD